MTPGGQRITVLGKGLGKRSTRQALGRSSVGTRTSAAERAKARIRQRGTDANVTVLMECELYSSSESPGLEREMEPELPVI